MNFKNAMLGLSMVFALTTANFARAQEYAAGQAVEWNDKYSKFGGGWIPATIVKDLGPNIVERYVIHYDGKDAYYDDETRPSLLRPRAANDAGAGVAVPGGDMPPPNMN